MSNKKMLDIRIKNIFAKYTYKCNRKRVNPFNHEEVFKNDKKSIFDFFIISS